MDEPGFSVLPFESAFLRKSTDDVPAEICRVDRASSWLVVPDLKGHVSWYEIGPGRIHSLADGTPGRFVGDCAPRSDGQQWRSGLASSENGHGETVNQAEGFHGSLCRWLRVRTECGLIKDKGC